MKISVVFPNVMYREGQAGVAKLIRGIEDIGFDELDMFDHVVMGYPTETRRKPFYSPQMPIVEAFTLLSFAAAITSRIKLGPPQGVNLNGGSTRATLRQCTNPPPINLSLLPPSMSFFG